MPVGRGLPPRFILLGRLLPSRRASQTPASVSWARFGQAG